MFCATRAHLQLPEEMEGEEGAGEEDTAVRARPSLVSEAGCSPPLPRPQELAAMKARLKEMEDEAAKLRAMQARGGVLTHVGAPVADSPPAPPPGVGGEGDGRPTHGHRR